MEKIPQSREEKEEILYPEVAAELLRRAEVDQAMRKKANETREWDLNVDVENTEWLKSVIAQIGWPTVSKVGKDAAERAWLLAQHADHDRPFQKACLILLKEQPEGEIKPAHIGYLEDRIRVHEGDLQLFGTQFTTNETGEVGPFPIDDLEHLDERRMLLKMEPFEEYRQRMLNLNKEGK